METDFLTYDEWLKEDMEQYKKDFEKNQTNGFFEVCVFIFGFLILGIFIWLI